MQNKNGMADSVDPDETAHYKPSHLDLHCLHRYLFRSAGVKGFNLKTSPCIQKGSYVLHTIITPSNGEQAV